MLIGLIVAVQQLLNSSLKNSEQIDNFEYTCPGTSCLRISVFLQSTYHNPQKDEIEQPRKMTFRYS